MFEDKDGDDLRKELGLANERSDELVNIVQNIMDQETPDGGYGRTSHVLLDIAGRKDLNDVEKAACVFLFCCKALNKAGNLRSEGRSKVQRPPEISMRHMPMPMPGMGELKAKEFIDIEGGASGMMIAPEGIGPEDAIYPIMALLMSMLRQMPKSEAQEFCRHASLSFAKIAMTGEVKL
jgi:hypothetical protein